LSRYPIISFPFLITAFIFSKLYKSVSYFTYIKSSSKVIDSDESTLEVSDSDEDASMSLSDAIASLNGTEYFERLRSIFGDENFVHLLADFQSINDTIRDDSLD